ncbi:MAG: GNAT family N-acyltransferase [Polaromonas sp.]
MRSSGIRSLRVQWASCEEDVRQAQRLRYRVFAQEMGARLTPPPGTEPGLDVDGFDPFCDHLLVKSVGSEGLDEAPVVGTYRLLAPDAARRAGGLYIDTEFDLSPLSVLRPQAVELGRSCVDPDWRSGGVIMALWAALCRYMRQRRLETMIGCASVALDDGGHSAQKLWHSLRHTHLVAAPWQVQPHTAFPLGHGDTAPSACAAPYAAHAMPPLIKGYLRCGARLLGPPALDAAFCTADLPMMLRFDDLAPRYREHFMNGD